MLMLKLVKDFHFILQTLSFGFIFEVLFPQALYCHEMRCQLMLCQNDTSICSLANESASTVKIRHCCYKFVVLLETVVYHRYQLLFFR